MSLSSRLIASYIVIISITLLLAFFTLLLVARPVQGRLTEIRVTAQSRLAARQIDRWYQQQLSSEEIVRQFNETPLSDNFRLILLDAQGVALADNRNAWVGQQFPLDVGPSQNESRSGAFTTPNGQRAVYAAEPIGPDDNSGFVVALAPRTAVLPGVIRDLGWGYLMAGSVAFLVSLIIGVLIARSIALPLQRIAQAATAVAAGDYSHRVPERGPPEIKRVSASFNTMADRVEAGQQAMRDFVSNVSHELKTPLTSIQGFSQAMLEGATQDEAAQRRAAGIIHDEATRMRRLVEDLLDLARIDSGQIVMHKTPLDVVQILNSTVDRLLPQAAEKNVELVKKWEKLPQIVGDGDRLAQVFTNLLDNAVRHTPSGGQVTIAVGIAKDIALPRRVKPHLVEAEASTSVSRRGAMAQISISDTGPGISPDELARIFERFYQVDKSRKRDRGAGLGLAIIKEIVESHSGYVTAGSQEGQGTTFTIFLPFTEADAQTLISSRR